MTTYRENLIDRMIAMYGFEHPIVIEFAKLCECYEESERNNELLNIIVEAHENEPHYEGEEV